MQTFLWRNVRLKNGLQCFVRAYTHDSVATNKVAGHEKLTPSPTTTMRDASTLCLN